MKRGYKATIVGNIPEEWCVRMLSDVSAMKSGESITAASITQHDAYPCYGGNGLRGYTSSFTHEGDFALIGRQGALCGNVNSASGMFFASEHAVVVTPRSGTDIHFLTYLLRELRLNRLSEASAQPGLSVSKILQLSVALPSDISEQRAIAQALGDVDALITALDRLIAKKRDIKQATMQQLLTAKIRLPSFSGKWSVQTIAELEKKKMVKLSRGNVISKKDIDSMPGDFPIYSSSIHDNGLFGCYGKFMLNEELITWSIDGGGNFFHRKKHKFSVTNVCGFMQVDTSQIDYRFMAAELQLLHSRKVFDYQSKAHPSIVRKEFMVQLPGLTEQVAIAGVLSDMDAELSAIEARRDKTRNLKQGMMQELLTGKTRLI
jgi:type I restriction enzyme S subunit